MADGRLRIICGPTGAGKSAIAIDLGETFNAAIVSADSRQIYRRFDIGTAKPTRADRTRVAHYGIDVVNPEERYSAARWVADAQDWIARLSKWRQYGNPATTRRFAASQIINRSQSVFPRAVETPDRSTIEVRRASGAVETYTIPWTKTGFPITTVGPVPSSVAALQ